MLPAVRCSRDSFKTAARHPIKKLPQNPSQRRWGT